MPAINQFDYSTGRGPSDPAAHAETVTPSDSADLTHVSRAVYVGSTGSLAVIMLSGAAVTFVNVPAGSLLPIRVSRIKSTGTTASSLLAIS